MPSGLGMLLVARALQGVGAAMVSGNNLAILTAAVRPAARPGHRCALVGWPLLFMAPAPLALWAAWRARRLPDVAPREHGSVDWMGAALLAITITVVAIAPNHPAIAVTGVLLALVPERR